MKAIRIEHADGKVYHTVVHFLPRKDDRIVLNGYTAYVREITHHLSDLNAENEPQRITIRTG